MHISKCKKKSAPPDKKIYFHMRRYMYGGEEVISVIFEFSIRTRQDTLATEGSAFPPLSTIPDSFYVPRSYLNAR